MDTPQAAGMHENPVFQPIIYSVPVEVRDESAVYATGSFSEYDQDELAYPSVGIKAILSDGKQSVYTVPWDPALYDVDVDHRKVGLYLSKVFLSRCSTSYACALHMNVRGWWLGDLRFCNEEKGRVSIKPRKDKKAADRREIIHVETCGYVYSRRRIC